MRFQITLCFVLILSSFNLFALESSDQFETSILKIYNSNIIVLNRGLEDAIYRNDHIKLTSDSGFIARGICVKATTQTSHWKIYRVVHPELVSKDTLYTLKSINQSEIPDDFKKLTTINLEKYFKNTEENNINKSLVMQQKRIAKYDLPQKIVESKIHRDSLISPYEKFIAKNFNPVEMKKDFSKNNLEVYADPLMWQSRENRSQTSFGASLYNTGVKYSYRFNMSEYQVKYPQLSERTTHYDIQLISKSFIGDFSVLTQFDYDRAYSGDRYFPLRRQQYTPLGLRYTLFEDKENVHFADITYAPVYDFFEYQYVDNSNNKINEIREGIRHQFKLRISNQISEYFYIRSEFSIKPLSNFKNNSRSNDMNPYANINIARSIGNGFFIAYDFKYEKDSLLKEVYGINSENFTNTIQLRYGLEL